MPVSRQRKKGPSKPRSVQQGAKLRKRQEEQQSHEHELSELAGVYHGFGEERRRLDVHRRELARERVRRILPGLPGTDSAADPSRFEDEVCTGLGELMFELSEAGEIEAHVGPDFVFEEALEAAAESVRRALAGIGGDPEGWRGPWSLFAVLARMACDELDDRARRLGSELRSRPGGKLLPEVPACAPAGPALWTRDAYGSRFAVIAPFPAPAADMHTGAEDRWYLWDVDACGMDAFTVYGGYFAEPDAALDAWREGVGPVAGARSGNWSEVDDRGLMALLLPRDLGMFEPGGEDAGQLAEYHRSRRLANELRASLGEFEIPDAPSRRSGRPETAEAARRFTAWLVRQRPDAPIPVDRAETVALLADDWFDNDLPGVSAESCSPHRVALFAGHCRSGFYQEDFADRLMKLLPDWVAWFAESIGLPEPLAAHCLRYAEGAPHPSASADGSIEILARVEE